MTQQPVYSIKATDIVKMALLTLSLLGFCIFFSLVTVLLKVYFTTARVRENARYLLFAHMLINDILNVVVGLFLVMAQVYFIYVPVPLCYIILSVAASTFRVTPYNLAAMSLERYVAICFPLRHGEFCSGQKSKIAIAVMWTLGLIPNVADLIVLSSSVEKRFFSHSVLCNRETLTKSSVQNTIKSNTHFVSLTLVGLIILSTYIKVMLIAWKIGSGTSVAFKAVKTVMLHAFQLLLSIISLMYLYIETYLKDYIVHLALINFCLFMCLPRFLSPLIYGVRDEMFSQYLKKIFTVKH
ncbi:odorant receptor 131-2-like [Rhinophrynus dorsalis]